MKTFTNNAIEKKPVESKEKKEILREVKRDNYSLGMAFLPLASVILWLGIVLINGLIIDPSRNAWQTTVNDQNRLIATEYGSTLVTHGELVVKTNQLAGVIEKDIQPEEVFILVEELFPEDPEFNVIGFGREVNGSFSVTVAAPTYIKFSKIARRFSQYEKVRDVQVVQASYDSKINQIYGTINFFFTTVELNSATTNADTTN